MDRSQSLLREVSTEKLKRDAENLRRYARFVVVLKRDEVELVDNEHLKQKNLPYAKLIAILGPVQYKGVSLEESVLMEIGYSRTRPYAEIAIRMKNEPGITGRSWRLSYRLRVANLSEEMFARVYPKVVKCMEKIVLEGRELWEVKKPWFVLGPGEVERGIHFTMSATDRFMHRQMCVEDVRYRKERYILRHASWIRSLFRNYKYHHYTPKQLRGFRNACIIADLLSQSHYTAFYRRVLREQFVEPSKVRALVDLVIEIFGIDLSLTEEEESLLRSSSIVLPDLVNLRCYRPPDQPVKHGKGSTIFELVLERSHREYNEVPF